MNKLIFLIIMLLCTDLAQAQVTQKWVQRYPSGHGYDVAIDHTGNIYVCGRIYPNHNNKFVTIKYNSGGSQIWIREISYTDSVDILEGAKALAVDYSGNVYVTGNVWHHERTDHDYITVKYDSTGDEQWRKFYNYAYVKNDNAYAIAVDGWGNVYVTGFSQGWDENYDYATLKYAPDGTRLWEQRYNGPGNGNDVAVSLTLDDNGNVFITGYSMGSYTGMDFATIKYWSNSGNLSWVTRSNGLVNGDDFARKIEIDAYGNAYVIGVSDGEDKTDFLTVKYSTAGTPLWAARYDRPGMSWESGYDIKIDASANVYVTGESNFGYNLKTCSQ